MEPKQGEEDVKIIEKKPKGPLKLQLESKQQDKPQKSTFGPTKKGEFWLGFSKKGRRREYDAGNHRTRYLQYL